MKFALASFFILTASAFASTSGTRGGGNLDVAEFYRIGAEVLQQLSPDRTETIVGTQVSIPLLQEVYSQALVAETDSTITLNGEVLDAENEPATHQIEFSLNAWSGFSLEQKKQLVIHELLGLAKITDKEYQVSQGLVDQSEVDSGAVTNSNGIPLKKGDVVLIPGTPRTAMQGMGAPLYTRKIQAVDPNSRQVTVISETGVSTTYGFDEIVPSLDGTGLEKIDVYVEREPEALLEAQAIPGTITSVFVNNQVLVQLDVTNSLLTPISNIFNRSDAMTFDTTITFESDRCASAQDNLDLASIDDASKQCMEDPRKFASCLLLWQKPDDSRAPCLISTTVVGNRQYQNIQAAEADLTKIR